MMRPLLSPRFMVSLGLVAALVVAAAASERSAREMSDSATRFLASLTPDQRAKASIPFGSEERTRWNYIPTEMFPRQGLLIKDMTEPQRKLVHDLLKTGLSQRGYLTATAIMDLETVLGALESAGATDDAARGRRMVRDPERYFVSIFGTPATRGAWGWRVDGHHVSLHFTVVNGSLVAGAPTFFGSNPAEVRSGPKAGLRILGGEEDAARTLLLALDEPRRAKAVLKIDAPGDILTTNKVAVDPLSPVGITAAELAPNQRELLMRLIDAYASMMTNDVSADRMDRIKKAGVEKIAFAWAGEVERGRKHYYRVQGPTFLIEYDNTQDNANHIHSVWRDFSGDFGRDLLREHLRNVAH
jgi:Protein of unknown function (DUF3500)